MINNSKINGMSYMYFSCKLYYLQVFEHQNIQAFILNEWKKSNRLFYDKLYRQIKCIVRLHRLNIWRWFRARVKR